MKLESLKVVGVGGIDDIDINLNPSMNIICGPNGIGKTTILECVAHIFAAGEITIIKRHARYSESQIKASFSEGSERGIREITLKQFAPDKADQIHIGGSYSQKIISLKTVRTFSYASLGSISRDPSRNDWELGLSVKNGVVLTDVKNWFVNRHLYSKHEGSLDESQIENIELAKRCFSELDPSFSFSRVTAADNEILVNSPTGEIYYEYLSSGFKSCIAMLLGIIKEIEFRFRPQIAAKDFDGIILIDEVELHLHPEWQSKIITNLTNVFPSAQFIVTTHSPHVIQSANPDQILALEFRDGRAVSRVLPDQPYGFKGWTLDEVLIDVMGMNDTRNSKFRELINNFDKAIADQNFSAAELAYEELDKSLHPNSHTRKILRIQMAGISE